MSILETFKKEGYNGCYIIPFEEVDSSPELSEEILSLMSEGFALSVCKVVSDMDYVLVPLSQEDVVESKNFNLVYCKESVSRLFKEKGLMPLEEIPLSLYVRNGDIRSTLDYVLYKAQEYLQDTEGYIPALICKDDKFIIIEARLHN